MSRGRSHVRGRRRTGSDAGASHRRAPGSSAWPAPLRWVAATVVLAAAATAVWFAARVGIAGFRVNPLPLLRPTPAMAVRIGPPLEAVRRARELVPGEAHYAFLEGDLRRDRALSAWLGEGFEEESARAVDAAANAVALLPTEPYYRLLLGGLWLDRARHPSTGDEARDRALAAAATELDAALDASPRSPLVWHEAGMEMVRAWRLLDSGPRQLALERLRQAAAWESRFLEPAFRQLVTHLEIGDLPDALAAAAPETAEGRIHLGAALERIAPGYTLRRPDLEEQLKRRALDAYVQAAELEGLDAASTGRWADRWVRLLPEDAEGLLAAARQLQERHPEAVGPPLAVARAAMALERTDEALQAMRQAVDRAEARAEADPGGSRGALQLVLERQGQLLLAADRHEGALAAFERLSGLREGDPRPLIQAARSLDALGRTQQALERYRDAVRRAPDSAEARRALARAYADRLDYTNAIEAWRWVARSAPDDVESRLQIARAYRELGLVDEALRFYSEALEASNGSVRIRAEMRDVLAGSGGEDRG